MRDVRAQHLEHRSYRLEAVDDLGGTNQGKEGCGHAYVGADIDHHVLRAHGDAVAIAAPGRAPRPGCGPRAKLVFLFVSDQFSWPGFVNLPFWGLLAFSVTGIKNRLRTATDRKLLLVLVMRALAGFLSVWMVAFSTSSHAARLAFAGLPALACLAASGVEDRNLAFRLSLPLIELCGALIAIGQDVLGVHWK